MCWISELLRPIRKESSELKNIFQQIPGIKTDEKHLSHFDRSLLDSFKMKLTFTISEHKIHTMVFYYLTKTFEFGSAHPPTTSIHYILGAFSQTFCKSLCFGYRSGLCNGKACTKLSWQKEQHVSHTQASRISIARLHTSDTECKCPREQLFRMSEPCIDLANFVTNE